jgi:hypothetical protein
MAIRQLTPASVAVMLLFGCVAASAVAAHSRTHTSAASSLNDLMNEVRAVRGEVQEMAARNLQPSLLVGRVQLQQARANGVAFELSEVRRTLQGAKRGGLRCV